jgi:predicted TIM-barrel enzyme
MASSPQGKERVHPSPSGALHLGTPSPGESHLVTPGIPKSPLTPLLAGLLPNRNHNDDLVRDLQAIPPAGRSAQPVFSVFAADPFIEGKRVAYWLLAKGYRRVVNWPTTAQYESDFCAALDSVNLGPRQEYECLSRLADRGLSISLALASPDEAAQCERLKPEMIFFTPSFELWSNGALRSAELLRRCKALARALRRETPIILMATRNTISLAEARKAGASAVLWA